MHISLQLQLLQITQYSILYATISLIMGIIIDHILPYHPSNIDYEDVPTIDLIVEILIQTILISISVHYIKQFVPMVPFVMSHHPAYKGHNFEANVIISFFFVGTQRNYIQKIIILHGRLYRQMKDQLMTFWR